MDAMDKTELIQKLIKGSIQRAIQELGSMAHIVDMHQFTKDPDRYLLKSDFYRKLTQAHDDPFRA